jgi:hypothetical protein
MIFKKQSLFATTMLLCIGLYIPAQAASGDPRRIALTAAAVMGAGTLAHRAYVNYTAPLLVSSPVPCLPTQTTPNTHAQHKAVLARETVATMRNDLPDSLATIVVDYLKHEGETPFTVNRAMGTSHMAKCTGSAFKSLNSVMLPTDDTMSIIIDCCEGSCSSPTGGMAQAFSINRATGTIDRQPHQAGFALNKGTPTLHHVFSDGTIVNAFITEDGAKVEGTIKKIATPIEFRDTHPDEILFLREWHRRPQKAIPTRGLLPTPASAAAATVAHLLERAESKRS